MKVLIFKLNHLGDSVVFVPVVQTLRKRFPEWHLTLVTTPSEAPLFEGPARPQEIITAPFQTFTTSPRRPWELAGWAWRLRRQKPDACLISFDQGNAAHLIALLSGARVRIGSDEHSRFPGSLTENIWRPQDDTPANWNWRMGAALVRTLMDEEVWPSVPPPPDLSHLVSGAIPANSTRKRVIVHSGASGYLNQWPRDKFVAVATSLSRDFEVVWIEHGNSLAAAPAGTRAAPVASLGMFADWLDTADLFLGNNSGPMHVANALGCPGVVVTGPSAAGWDPYWHRDRWTVLRHPDLYCAPCERLNQRVMECANRNHPMACLKYWSAEMVESACRARLAAVRKP